MGYRYQQCPASGQPAPDNIYLAHKAGTSYDPDRSINPKSNAFIGSRKKDVYICSADRCPSQSGYVTINKDGTIKKHGGRVWV